MQDYISQLSQQAFQLKVQFGPRGQKQAQQLETLLEALNQGNAPESLQCIQQFIEESQALLTCSNELQQRSLTETARTVQRLKRKIQEEGIQATQIQKTLSNPNLVHGRNSGITQSMPMLVSTANPREISKIQIQPVSQYTPGTSPDESAFRELESRLARIEKNEQAHIQMLSAQIQLMSAEQLRQQRENEALKSQIAELQARAKETENSINAHNVALSKLATDAEHRATQTRQYLKNIETQRQLSDTCVQTVLDELDALRQFVKAVQHSTINPDAFSQPLKQFEADFNERRQRAKEASSEVIKASPQKQEQPQNCTEKLDNVETAGQDQNENVDGITASSRTLETPGIAGQSDTKTCPSVITQSRPTLLTDYQNDQPAVQKITVPAPEISVNVVPPQNEIRVELVQIPPSPRPCVNPDPPKEATPDQNNQAPDTTAPSPRRRRRHHHHHPKPEDDGLALDWDQ